MCQSPLRLPSDLPTALALADQSEMNYPHIADWPYRFSSWALDDPENTQAWFNRSGRMLGWAVMQTPFWAIDCQIHPDAPANLYPEILAWAQSRAAVMAAQENGHPMWFVSIPADCRERRRDLETMGFEDVSQDRENAWSKVLFELPEEIALERLKLPAGLMIRNLSIPSEVQVYVDAHRAAFQSKNMTFEWRIRSTQMTDYRNELDLVAVTEDGELAGFCVSWMRTLTTGVIVGQIEPLGVREVYRDRKLSQALLTEAIQKLRDHGAVQIYAETDHQREAAMTAYASIGFSIANQVLVYRYIVPEP